MSGVPEQEVAPSGQGQGTAGAFWTSWTTQTKALAVGAAVLALVAVVGLLMLTTTSQVGGDNPATAQITDCVADLYSGDTYVSGTVSSDSTGDVYLEWAYLDSSGNFLGSNNYIVRSVNAGESLRWDDSGWLDRVPDGDVRCELREISFMGP